MRVVFRADASSRIGLGHIMRCVALALELRERGHEIRFVCRDLPGGPDRLLEEYGLGVDWLPALAPGPERSDAARWQLVAEEDDAEEVLALAGKVDWVVVDHYGLGRAWEAKIRESGPRVLTIDDLANRDHDVDLLLDQNLDAPTRPFQSREMLQLLGPKFALLRPEFATSAPAGSRDARRVLVCFGGTDTGSLTLQVAEELLGAAESVVVDAVVTEANPGLPWLAELARSVNRLHVHIDTPHMAALMRSAALMVGASGSTSWERCALGLPAVTVSLAENQEPIAAALHRRRASCHLGPAERVHSRLIAEVTTALLQHPRLLERMRRRARAVCDGKGAARVAAVLES